MQDGSEAVRGPDDSTSRVAVGQVLDVPADIRALAAFRRPDYIDVFALDSPAPVDGSPERWARVVLEESAGFGGQFVWRVLLGLRLRWRKTPTHVAGWRIAARGDGWIELAARSPLLSGHLLVRAQGRELSLTTALHYRRRLGARIWSRLSATHRRAAPTLLRQAYEAERARGAAGRG
ncbi:hypothetical protein [Streptomyces alkaliterrae]|uniref:hypothetical protein n=1 Tax=Streptomyces alkaliterrae TaxID=2213162 RepID=UPI001E582F29|nr:hypothetical protein [Streptomyces alkaliterrae]